jgi:hypothetical protein
MLSARRSYLELVKEELGMPLLPEYWDFNTKLNYNLSASDKISLIGLFALDNAFPYEQKKDFWEDTVRIKLLASGIKYEKSGKHYNLSSTVGYNWNNYVVNYDNYNLDIDDNELYLKQEADFKLNKIVNMNLYAAGKYIFSRYYINKYGGFNSSNYYSPAILFDSLINSYKIALGANLVCSFLKNSLILNFGIRADRFGYIEELLTISPRVGLSYKMFSDFFVNASYGIYYQPPELLWVSADADNKYLRSIRSDSYVLGAEHYFSEDIRVNIEGYLKQYQFYPVSVYDPNFIFINSGVDFYPNFLEKAVSEGNGYFTGIDITFQKKNLTSGLYWTLVYSFSHSKFLASIGDIQPAQYDYGNQLTAIIGFKLKSNWSFSTRVKYAGPRPYTPYDEANSIAYNRGIYDKTRYNQGRLPEYVRCDIRIDKQLNIGPTSLAAYIELENMFNRKNVFNYYWSWQDDKLRANTHWTILLIGGLSFQF